MQSLATGNGGVPTPTDETRGDRTRRAILTAARERFTSHGFEETTLGDIAADAGVSGPTVAHHFGNKAGLLTAVVNDHYDDLVERIDAVIDAERSPMQRLFAFARFWLRAIDGWFPLYAIFLANGGMRATESETGRALRANNARVTKRFERLVDDLKADGTLRAEVGTRLVRDAFFGMAEHVLRAQLHARRPLDHEAAADRILGLVLTGAAAPHAPDQDDDRLAAIETKLDAVLARLKTTTPRTGAP
jgi:TetR/AcrR family transcriptional regulator, fatty acid metabolism regulator protein